MKRKILFNSFALFLITLTSCGNNIKKGATYKWEIVNQKYENFIDLGDYVVEVDENKNFDLNSAIEYANSCYDKGGQSFGCTAFGTTTKSGDVIIGRNLDLSVSQYPCYITHVNTMTYKTINFTFNELIKPGLTYAKLLEDKKIPAECFNSLPLFAADSFNEKGLYMECNMRGYEEYMFCTGTNPLAETRICSLNVPFLVTSNCATVKEAVNFMRTKLDIYTVSDGTFASGWNMCYMIGDSTGEYGLIEVAHNEISYLPYQHGQGNYYVTPRWNVLSRGQSGYGRLEFGLDRIDTIQSEQDMADLMEKIMWRNEILNIQYAKRVNGHVMFFDYEGNESIDWRSDNVKHIPVNENGEFVDIYAENLTEEAACVKEYKTSNPALYQEYLDRSDLEWVSNDKNFESLQKGLIDYYRNSGILEKLEQYYSGNETPLRDDGSVWTTGLSITANCTQKRITVRFWEKPNTIMTYQF